MNDSSSAIEEIIAATAPPDGGVATPEPESPDIRGAILSGRFLGLRDYALEDALTGFLAEENDAALAHWLPEGWTGSSDDVRGLLDRATSSPSMPCSPSSSMRILHHDRLRRLERTWRGLVWLVGGIESGSRLKTKILNIGWAEICRDLERAVEFDQSNLFRKIYEEEFGMPGGEPYGLMIVDHDIRHRAGPTSRTDDVSALAALAGVAAAAFCPTLVGASPVLLEVDDFADLATVTDIASPLRNADHARWRNLTTRVDTRFLGVTLPRLLARPPWEDNGTRADLFRYQEYAPEAKDRVWMSAGYAFAQVVGRAFAQRGAWPGDTRGADLAPRSTGRRHCRCNAGGTVPHRPGRRVDPQIRRNRLERSSGAGVARCRSDPSGINSAL